MSLDVIPNYEDHRKQIRFLWWRLPNSMWCLPIRAFKGVIISTMVVSIFSKIVAIFTSSVASSAIVSSSADFIEHNFTRVDNKWIELQGYNLENFRTERIRDFVWSIFRLSLQPWLKQLKNKLVCLLIRCWRIFNHKTHYLTAKFKVWIALCRL